ncbi:MAG: DUF4286 family protein [Niabella sp.]
MNNPLVYNVTTKVSHAIHEAWLNWLRTEYIPAMIATGCFSHATALHLIEQDDEEGITYAVQYFAASIEDYERFCQADKERLRALSFAKWGNQFISFSTLMQVVH